MHFMFKLFFYESLLKSIFQLSYTKKKVIQDLGPPVMTIFTLFNSFIYY